MSLKDYIDTLAPTPDWLKAIGEEAMLVGLLDRFEIWDPERYQSASAVDDERLPEAFKLI